MELRQLRYFVALAEELHYGAAAERLRIAKPTLSQQIAVLERSLGVQLVDRRRRNVLLTPAGAVLRDEARSVLAQCDRMRDAVTAAMAERAQIDLRVAYGLDALLLDQLLAVQDAPELRVNFSMTNGLDAEDAVTSGRAHAAVIWVPSGTHTTLHAEQLTTYPVALAVPEGHRFCTRDAVSVEEVAGEPITLFPRAMGPGIWDAFVHHLLPAGPAPGQVVEEVMGLIPMHAILRGVAEGRAVAPFVRAVGERLAPPGVVFKPLDPPLDLPVTFLCRDPARPELRRLVEVLRAQPPSA